MSKYATCIRTFFIAFVLLVAMSFLPSAHARVFAQQAATATLNGRVMDPNGAVVPGAVVTVTEKSTGAKRETTTNGDGVYVLSNLAPGEYNVRVEAKGFSNKASSDPIVLNVGQVVSLDAKLEVNALNSTETITLDKGGLSRNLLRHLGCRRGDRFS